MISAVIRPITPEEAFPLLRYALRPALPASASRYAGDDHPAAIHLGALADLGDGAELVEIVSFVPQREDGLIDPTVARLQRMVTLIRNQGAGTQLVRHGLSKLRATAARRVWCNGRTPATSFYERLGFHRVGDGFVTPGTGPHHGFVLDLTERRLRTPPGRFPRPSTPRIRTPPVRSPHRTWTRRSPTGRR